MGYSLWFLRNQVARKLIQTLLLGYLSLQLVRKRDQTLYIRGAHVARVVVRHVKGPGTGAGMYQEGLGRVYYGAFVACCTVKIPVHGVYLFHFRLDTGVVLPDRDIVASKDTIKEKSICFVYWYWII